MRHDWNWICVCACRRLHSDLLEFISPPAWINIILRVSQNTSVAITGRIVAEPYKYLNQRATMRDHIAGTDENL